MAREVMDNKVMEPQEEVLEVKVMDLEPPGEEEERSTMVIMERNSQHLLGT